MTEKEKGKRRGLTAVLCASAAVLLLAAFLTPFAYARYVTESEGLFKGVAVLDVKSTVTYTDAWGTYATSDGSLSEMMPDSDGEINFLVTVTNNSEVPVSCSITVTGDYEFTLTAGEGCALSESDDDPTVTLDGIIAARGEGSASFTVKVGDFTPAEGYTDYTAYTGTLMLTFSYVQEEG